MPRRRRSAAEFVDAHREVPIILGDMIEHLGSALQHWSRASSLISTDPDRAMTALIDAEIDLDIPLRIGRTELLTVMRGAIGRLDAEMPEEQ